MRQWLLRSVFGLLTLAFASGAHSFTINSIASTDWQTATTWQIITAPGGTISTSTASTTVNGVGTPFTQLQAGDRLLTAANALIGTVASVTSATQLTLTANATVTLPAGSAYRIQKVPGALDDVTIVAGNAVTLNSSVPSAASALSLQIASNAAPNGASASLTHAAGIALTVGAGGVTITSSGDTNGTVRNWVINAGTATVNGNLRILQGGNNNARVARVNITTGTLTVTGNLTMTSTNAVRVVIDMTGGQFNLGGTFTFNNATLTMGANAVFNYNGSVAQTVAIGSSLVYTNLHLNNTNAAFPGGATLGAAITAANVTGNVRVQSGFFNNGGFAIVGSAGDTFEVADGARFRLTGTSTLPSGFGTRTFGATSTTSYQGGNQAVGSGVAYGHLILDGTAASTKTPAAGTINVAGDFTIQGTNTSYAGGNNPAVNLSGNFTNSATAFTSGTGVYTFTGGAAQTWGGTFATTITTLTISKSANEVTIACGTPSPTVSGTLTLTTGNIVTSGTTGSGCATACANQVPIIVGAAGTIAGGNSSSYVLGALRKNFNAAGTLNFRGAGLDEFPIGIAGSYLPIEITSGTTSTAGNVIACVTGRDHPNMTEPSGGGIDTTRSVNRYWSMTTTTINTAAALVDATFKFTNGASEYDGGATPGSFIVERWDGADWNPTTLVTAGATSTRASGINISAATNDFQIGERLASFPPTLGNFNAFDTTAPAGAVLGVIQTKQAGTAFSVRVVRLVNNAIDTTYNQAGVTVELYNASNNGGAYTNGCRATWSAIPGTALTVTFVAGVVTANFAAANVPNVFRDVRVHVVKAGAGAGEGCSSDRFAIRPTSLAADASDGTWQTAGTTRTLANIAATGGNVHAASDSGASTPRPFTLRATPAAAGGQSAANYDGSPSIVAGFPVCCSPSTTPACGTLPAACATGTLSYTAGSWAGTGTRTNPTAHYNEAGVLNLRLEDANFASVDASDGSSAAARTIPAAGTASVGRFVPDHFTFTSPNTPALQTFGSSCASRSFTYVGQTFWYPNASLPTAAIEARSAGDSLTSNYRGALFKLTASAIGEAYSNNGTGPTLNVGSAVSPPQLSAGDGTGTYTAAANATNVNLAYARDNSTPIIPFNANISLTVTASDSSEAAVSGNGTISHASSLVFNSIAFDSGSDFRYGRVRLLNAAGPANVDLPVTLRAEYYLSAAAGFVVNGEDNCTPLAVGNFKLTDHAGSLTPANMPDTRVSVPASLTSGLANGMKLLKASPAVTTPGSVRICFDLDVSSALGDTTCQATSADRTFLQGPWAGGAHDKDPKGQVNVGTFGAQLNNFIFFRENY